MDHNYSILQWDVGACGSFIHCMSDLVRYDIPFSEDYLPENAFRPDVVTQLIEDIPYNNEFKAGIYADELKNWFINTPDGTDTRSNCVNEIETNGVSDHIKMHWLTLDTETYFCETFSKFGYKKFVKIQATSPQPLVLMHIKRAGRDPFKSDAYTKFIIDRNRCQVQDRILERYFQVNSYSDTLMFRSRRTFTDIIRDLSGSDNVSDEMWEYAQEYNERNEKLYEWARANFKEACQFYSEYYWKSIMGGF